MDLDVYNIRGLEFEYPKSEYKALKDVSIDVKKGEFMLICGHSGCGKTTLIKMLKSIASPFGNISGSIFYNGALLENVEPRRQASEIGYVFQNPESQIVTDKVWHELAFGLENLGLDTPTIRIRVAEMASFFGIQNWFHKSVEELSGGQKQILNLASIMVMKPEVILLDEPTAQLDPIARQDFLDTLVRVNRELGTTVIMCEHNLEEVMPFADRVVVMEKGEILTEGKPQAVGEYLRAIESDMFLAMPTAMKIFQYIDGGENSPMTVREGRKWLEQKLDGKTLKIPFKKYEAGGELAVDIEEAWFSYEDVDVIKGLSAKVYRGEIYSILGGNGVGKSTALSLIAGINKEYRGKVSIKEGLSVGMLAQNPQLMFVSDTVLKDLKEVCSDTKKIEDIARLCYIEGFLDRHPYDLSGGEAQRVALAKILLLKPDILLLDEPTKGFDEHFKTVFGEILKRLKSEGMTIVMVSHDIEFCAKYSERCGMFFDGGLVMEEECQRFFSGNRFYTTAVNRMCGESIENAVTIEQVLNCFEKNVEDKTKSKLKDEPKDKSEGRAKAERTPLSDISYEVLKSSKEEARHFNKRLLTASLLILLIIPLVIFFGMWVLDDRKYYFISMIIIACTMLPFVMVFENRQPQARELVVIAVVCAIAVLGRMMFFMTQQFKPVIAIVIIAGICLGAESGFMVGAITGFVSNFFMGQGPWTPWQMFSLGIIGFIAGIGLKRVRDRYIIAIFGGLATVIIYGGIMNPASVLMYQDKPNLDMILFSYATGFVYDVIHAVSTVIFLLLFAVPFSKKLDRIKVKYGILGG